MKKLTILLFTFCVVVALNGFNRAYAQGVWQLLRLGGTETTETEEDKIKDLEDEIEKYEKKLKELENQEVSLQREIENFDSQIALTQLRITQARNQIVSKEKEIEQLKDDIEDLKIRIDKLRNAMEYQKEVLNNRLRERYKSKESSPLVMVLGANNFTALVQQTQYLRALEEQDHKLIMEMTQTKDAFNLQKDVFEDKKTKEEVLKRQLEEQKANFERYNNELAQKKAEKDALLQQTQNDEAKFQELLAEAQQELLSITNAVSVLIGQEPKNVDKGDVIGIQGSSGFSSGDHLHFGVYRYASFAEINGWNWYYSNYVDPKKVLKNKTVYWNTGCESAGSRSVGDGDFSWPMSTPTISQGFGYTCWSPIYYGGKVHPAYDMYGPYGSPVYAVEDGKAYFCRNCLGDGGNGVFIFHDDKYMTVYWHLR